LFSCRAIFRRYAGSDRYRAAWIVRRSIPHSFNAAARVFCREAADHFPTARDAVACPYFSDPAGRSRSGQQASTRFSFRRADSSGPACGYGVAIAAGVSSRIIVIFPRSRTRGDSTFPVQLVASWYQ
jgi:hypothetical protein